MPTSCKGLHVIHIQDTHGNDVAVIIKGLGHVSHLLGCLQIQSPGKVNRINFT